MSVLGISRGLFVLAAAGLGILSLVYGTFAPNWTTLPAWIVYGEALLVLAASAGLCASRAVFPSALAIGMYLATWVVTSAATAVSKPLSVGSWYDVCEGVASLVGIWILHVMLREKSRGSQTISTMTSERALRAARAIFGLACVEFGLGHFAYGEYTASLVPTWLPGRLEIAYLTGLCHVAAGMCLATGIVPRLAVNLEAIMMSLFGLLVWVPSLFVQPRPTWATPPQNQRSEIEVNLLLAAAAWVVAASLSHHSWGFPASRNETLH